MTTLPFMTLEKTLTDIDALILVHLDFAKSYSEEYQFLIGYASFFVESWSKPVIIIPENRQSRFRHFPSKLKKVWEIAPEDAYLEPNLLLQILLLTQDTPLTDLVLGFGGIYYDACVASLAKRTCESYDGPPIFVEEVCGWEDINFVNPKAKQGYVIKELSVKRNMPGKINKESIPSFYLDANRLI